MVLPEVPVLAQQYAWTNSLQNLVYKPLVILTGFVFVSRVISRVILIIVYVLLRIPFRILAEFLHGNGPGIAGIFLSIFRAFEFSLALGFFLLFTKDEWIPLRPGLTYSDEWGWWMDKELILFGILGAIDRLLLVAIAFAATVSSLSFWREALGIAGLVLLILVYIFTGRFTFILKDAVHKAEDEHEELVSATRETKN